MISKKNNKEKHKKQIEKINEYQEELDRKYKEEKQKYTFKSLLSRLKSESYTKTIVAIVVFVALIDLQLSYVLAFLDKEQIAETLSVQVCITILGTVLVYIIREYFDAKAEKREEMIKEGILGDNKKSSSIKKDLENMVNTKINELVVNSGISEHINTEEVKLPQTENPIDG